VVHTRYMIVIPDYGFSTIDRAEDYVSKYMKSTNPAIVKVQFVEGERPNE
jgi:hypothetical protein